MKYVNPSYEKEMILSSDVICESPYQVAHVEGVVDYNESGEPIMGTITQVTVNAGNLF